MYNNFQLHQQPQQTMDASRPPCPLSFSLGSTATVSIITIIKKQALHITNPFRPRPTSVSYQTMDPV